MTYVEVNPIFVDESKNIVPINNPSLQSFANSIATQCYNKGVNTGLVIGIIGTGLITIIGGTVIHIIKKFYKKESKK